MSWLNATLRGLFDLLLRPFQTLPWWAGLSVVSFVAAIAMLSVFGVTSNQKGITAVKRRIQAGLFEIRLFSNDLSTILRAQLDILRHTLTYLRLSLVPMLWMIVPFVLIVAQLQFHYGYHGLDPGQTAIVKVRLKEGWNQNAAVAPARPATKPRVWLLAPAGITVETPPLWIPALREMDWRVRALKWGDYELQVKAGEQLYAKDGQVSRGVRRRSPVRVEAGFLSQLLYPAEDPLPAGSPIESITLTYPDNLIVLGVPFWLIVFFLLSTAFAFVLKKRFGVDI
jgi:uncharacterized membrane protein (DUF106 family)